MQSFDAEVSALGKKMNFPQTSSTLNMETLGDALENALFLGGGLGIAGAGGYFALVLLGPLGWAAAVAVCAAIFTALMGLGDSSSTQDAIRKQCLESFRENINKNKSDWSAQIADNIKVELDKVKESLSEALKERTDALTRPYLQALEQLQHDKETREEKVRQLAVYEEALSMLMEEGAQLCQSLER